MSSPAHHTPTHHTPSHHAAAEAKTVDRRKSFIETKLLEEEDEAILEAWRVLQSGDNHRAIDLFTTIIATRQPLKADYFIGRSTANWSIGNYQSAVADAKVAHHMEPNNVQAYYALSRAYFNLNDFQSSQETAKEGLVLDPHFKKLNDLYEEAGKLNPNIFERLHNTTTDSFLLKENFQHYPYDPNAVHHESELKIEPYAGDIRKSRDFSASIPHSQSKDIYDRLHHTPTYSSLQREISVHQDHEIIAHTQSIDLHSDSHDHGHSHTTPHHAVDHKPSFALDENAKEEKARDLHSTSHDHGHSHTSPMHHADHKPSTDQEDIGHDHEHKHYHECEEKEHDHQHHHDHHYEEETDSSSLKTAYNGHPIDEAPHKPAFHV